VLGAGSARDGRNQGRINIIKRRGKTITHITKSVRGSVLKAFTLTSLKGDYPRLWGACNWEFQVGISGGERSKKPSNKRRLGGAGPLSGVETSNAGRKGREKKIFEKEVEARFGNQRIGKKAKSEMLLEKGRGGLRLNRLR